MLTAFCSIVKLSFFFQCILYVIVFYGLSVLRVCYGPLPIFLCKFAAFLSGFAILFGAITVAMYTFTRFMFVCIWKRMRQMDDDLIVRIATIQAIVVSLLFNAATWLKIQGQVVGLQVSFSCQSESAYRKVASSRLSRLVAHF